MSERKFKIDEKGEVVDTTKTFMDIMKNTNAWMSGTKKKPVKENKHSRCWYCIHANVCADYEGEDGIYDLEDCDDYIHEESVKQVVFCKDCIHRAGGGMLDNGYWCGLIANPGNCVGVEPDDFCSRGVHVL